MICLGHMASLESVASSRTFLEQGAFSGLEGSMQRGRGLGRGQRDLSSDAQNDDTASIISNTSSSTSSIVTPRPSRTNSKLKVLVRSHAMREEASPPREPTPTPCITLIPSSSSSPEHHGTIINSSPILQQPSLIFSPSVSPTPIVLATSPDTSPQASDTESRTQDSSDPKKINGCDKDKFSNSEPVTNKNSSPVNQKSSRGKTELLCECFGQSCAKCGKNNDRNFNNNNSNNVNNNNVVSSNTLTVSRASVKHKFRQQSSSQGSFEGSSSTSPCLSRDSSTEQYTDTTGIDLTQFIHETLNKNAKDRALMLKIEQELVTLAKDKIKTHFKFPPMSSYQRMLVHRCAAYFGMDHNIEVSGKCVVVNKTKNTRIPEMRFRDHIREDLLLFPEEPRRSILKRDSNSFEDCNYKSPDRHFDNRRSKSFEEREEEYEKVRRRIFKDGTLQDSQEDFNWADMPWPESECSKIRLLPPEQNSKQNRLLKVQSVDTKSEPLRPCVSKSYSFGGYGGAVSVLSRGDSVTSTHSAGPRLLTKQDSGTSTISWRLSPSSSGYKSQSQRSDSVTPSPTATPHQLSDASEETVEQGQQTEQVIEAATGDANQLVWAVTDMQSVPKGSVLIDPQTGQPFTNQDGSIYHFDPSHPPPGFPPSKPPLTPTKTPSPQKSHIKDTPPLQSPKKIPKTRTSPLKSKYCLINSSTSPSLPVTPSLQQHQPQQQSMPLDNTAAVPMQGYSMYPNGFVQGGAPVAEGNMQVYQQPVGMVYGSYAVPPTYDNRTDASVPDLSGYFVNMAVSDSTCNTQPMSYQAPPPPAPQPQSSAYWGQQPLTYYQPTTQQQQPPQQRYPVQIPPQNQNTYMSTNFPHNYITPNSPQNTDLMSVYTNPPMQMIYPQQSSASNPIYVQNPNLFMQNPVYPPGATYPYPPSSNSANPVHYSSPSQCYMQNVVAYDQRQRNTSKTYNKSCVMTKIHGQGSSQSSGGSNSPANTVIAGYFPNSATQMNYRQCTPPQTPPSQNVGFGFPQNYVQHSVIFRPLGGIRASPPVNIRSSRSPTPAPEYPQIGSVDRNQRYPVGPPVYHSMPCIVPGDMRLMTGRAQPPVYRQPYRHQNVAQPVTETTSGRSHKVRKPRTKVPALPPSGRQSNPSVPPNTQQRF